MHPPIQNRTQIQPKNIPEENPTPPGSTNISPIHPPNKIRAPTVSPGTYHISQNYRNISIQYPTATHQPTTNKPHNAIHMPRQFSGHPTTDTPPGRIYPPTVPDHPEIHEHPNKNKTTPDHVIRTAGKREDSKCQKTPVI